MLSDANQQYLGQSQAEKDAAFDRQLKQAGVAQDSVNVIRGLIDDKLKADQYVIEAETKQLELEIKKLELENLSAKQKLELQQMRQDLELGKISTSQASQRIALDREKFAFDKNQQLTQTEREQYNKNIDVVDSSSFVSRDADGVTQISDKTGLRNYIIGLNLDDGVTDSLLLRYGLPIN